MGYRDEHEALKQKAEELAHDLTVEREGRARAEAELAGLRAGDDKLRRLDALAAELTRSQQEIAALRRELLASRGSPPGRPRRHLLVGSLIAAGLLMPLGGGLMWVKLRSRPPPPPPPAEVEAPVPPPPRAPEPPPFPSRSVHTRWKAKVQSAEGEKLAKGAACAVEATLRTYERYHDVKVGVTDLLIHCGEVVLYRHEGLKPEESDHGTTVEEVPGLRDGTFRHALHHYNYREPLVDLDSRQSRPLVTVTRKGQPPSRVVLAMDEYGESVAGPALFTKTEKEQRGYWPGFERTGRVIAASGAAPVGVGARVAVAVQSVWVRKEHGEETNCVVRMGREGETLAWHQAFCPAGEPLVVKSAQVSGAVDREDVELDMGRGVAGFSRKSEEKVWSVRVGLDAVPAGGGVAGR